MQRKGDGSDRQQSFYEMYSAPPEVVQALRDAMEAIRIGKTSGSRGGSKGSRFDSYERESAPYWPHVNLILVSHFPNGTTDAEVLTFEGKQIETRNPMFNIQRNPRWRAQEIERNRFLDRPLTPGIVIRDLRAEVSSLPVRLRPYAWGGGLGIAAVTALQLVF